MKHLLLLLLSGIHLLPAAAQSIPVDGYAAIVNNRIITVGDVLEFTEGARRRLRERYSGRERIEAQAEVFKEGLDQLIDNYLILAAFEDMEGQLPEGAVRERADNILRERFDNNRSRLLATLREVGKTEQEWREELREQILVQQLTREFVTRRIHITPRMIREHYKEHAEEFRSPNVVRLHVISLRPVPEDQMDERRARLHALRQELLDGADFAETARRVSQGSHAADGGDQGWVEPESLPSALREAVEQLEPGDISEPIFTPTQHFLLHVSERRGGEPIPLAEVQDDIEAQLRQEEYERLYDQWIESLKKQFTVIRFPTGPEEIQRIP